jgi:hypothetical protein
MNDQEFERLAHLILDDTATVVDTFLFQGEYKYRATPNPYWQEARRPSVPSLCQRAAKKIKLVPSSEVDEMPLGSATPA